MFTLLLLSLLHTITCTVYTVTPDDPNITCHHCHNLQHYLVDTTKYFTSNTQLLFLPGLHHLNTDLIIQNVHNISLIGTGDAVIQCVDSIDSVGLLMANITNLVIRSLAIKDCVYYEYDRYWEKEFKATLVIKECNLVTVYQLKVIGTNNLFRCSYTILGINILGSSNFNNFTCHGIRINYFEAKHFYREHNTISIINYQSTTACHSVFHLAQESYKVVIELSNLTDGYVNVDLMDTSGKSELIIMSSSIKCKHSFPVFIFSAPIMVQCISITVTFQAITMYYYMKRCLFQQ